MPGQCTPEIGELFDKIVSLSKFRFECAARVHVNHDRQFLIKNHLYCSVEIAQILGRNFVCMPLHKHGLRIDDEPYMIESHGLDQHNVFCRRVSLEMLFGVSLGIEHLSEPSRDIDAVTKVSEPLWRDGELRSIGGRRGGGLRKQNRRSKYNRYRVAKCWYHHCLRGDRRPRLSYGAKLRS